MGAITEAQLKQHLAEKAFASLYLLAGEEKYLVKRGAQRLIKAAGGESFPEFNRQELSGGASAEAIAAAVEALPFFTDHKCVAVADWDPEAQDQTELKKITQLLESLPETTTLLFWYPTLELDGKKAKTKAFLKLAEKQGHTLLFQRRDASDLRRLLLREAEKAGCQLSRENAGRILEYAGQDLTRLLSEMQKLCAYALGLRDMGQAEAAEITPGMIEELVSKSTETTVFLMANALVGGNHEKAYRLLQNLFLQNEEPVTILGALSSLYIDMYRVRAALESGRPATAPAEYGDYKGKEFRLRNGEKNARGMSLEALRESLDLLLKADLALKGSRLSPRTVLDQLIAHLLLASKGEQA